MCGRFVRHSDIDELTQLFEATWSGAALRPRYNITPSQQILAVREGSTGRELIQLRWGLIPSWSKEPKTPYSTINARAETVASKPTYRQAFKQRRCLIPADGFYEWHTLEVGKQPYYIRLQNDTPMAFAGLWEHWEKDDQVIESCSIIVTTANTLMQNIHDRMPVIVAPADFAGWLDPQQHDLDVLQTFLKPYPAEAMTAFAISTEVNSPRNDRPELVLPLNPL
jgi:putative SOS response-associated peptidase YedK